MTSSQSRPSSAVSPGDVPATLFDGAELLQLQEGSVNMFMFDRERNRNGALKKVGRELANVEILKSGKVIMNVELDDLAAADASRTRCGTFVSNKHWIGMITKVERCAQLKIMKNKRKIKVMLNEVDGRETLWTFLNPHLNSMKQRGDIYSDSEIPMYKGQIIKINKKLAESRYSIFSRLKKRCCAGLQRVLRRSNEHGDGVDDHFDALVKKVKVKSVEVNWVDALTAVGDAPPTMYTNENVDDLVVLAPDAMTVCAVNSTRIYRVGGSETMIDKDQWIRETAAPYINSETSVDEVDKSKIIETAETRSLLEGLVQNFLTLIGRLRKDKKKVVPGEEVAVKVLTKFPTAEVIWEDGEKEILEISKILQIMRANNYFASEPSDISSAPQETSEIVSSAPQETSEIVSSGAPQKTSEIISSGVPQETPEFVSSAPQETPEIVSSAPQETSEIVSSAPQETSKIVSSAPQETSKIVSGASRVLLRAQGIGRGLDGLDQLDDDAINFNLQETNLDELDESSVYEDHDSINFNLQETNLDDLDSSSVYEDHEFLDSFFEDAPANNPFKEGDFVAPARDFACLKSRYGIIRQTYKSTDPDVGPLAKVDWFEVDEKYDTTRLGTSEVPVCDLISMDQMSAIDSSFRVIWKSKQAYSSEIVFKRVGITTFNKKSPSFLAGYVTEITKDGELIIKASHNGDEYTWKLWPCEVASLKHSCYQDEMGNWKPVEVGRTC